MCAQCAAVHQAYEKAQRAVAGAQGAAAGGRETGETSPRWQNQDREAGSGRQEADKQEDSQDLE